MSQERASDRVLAMALAYDPLAMAEELTGDSYKTNKFTEAIGFGLAISHNRRRNELLKSVDDTTHGTTLYDYLRIAHEEGFEDVLALPFENSDGQTDALHILFQREPGILLVFDTYWGGKSVNGGHFYYNWKPTTDSKVRCRVTSSGGFTRADPTVWAGDHDCREALRFHIRQLREHGEFVTPWIERPFLWLLHYMDTKGNDGDNYKAINSERIAILPEYVRVAITPEAR